MCPRASLVLLEKTVGSRTCRESKHSSFFVRPVAFSVPTELPCIILGNAVSLCSDSN
jgi:hypothetical protein